jgi:hypothetical protein
VRLGPPLDDRVEPQQGVDHRDQHAGQDLRRRPR